MGKIIFSVVLFCNTCLFSQTVSDYYILAEGKVKNNDYQEAINIYTKVIESNPEDSFAYFGRGLSKMSLEDYQSAINDFNLALQFNPDNPEIFFDRAVSKGKMKDFFGAIYDYDRVLEYDPQNVRAYFNRGLAKIDFNQKDSGCLDLKKASEMGYSASNKMFQKYCK
jgi:tetratricopeptide (TPR) repeat protein